ncbi:MAG: hypothetical protein DRP27_08930 [Thermotogae bacterium]|nr:hypothetical protein [Thermotogota bacterium]RKX42809.1 MAG: hypothetical protein DRP27_08930 [Thermotogota bacterium]
MSSSTLKLILLLVGAFMYVYLAIKLFPIRARFAIFLYSLGVTGFALTYLYGYLPLIIGYTTGLAIVFFVVLAVTGL